MPFSTYSPDFSASPSFSSLNALERAALNGNTVLRRYSWQPAAVGLDVPISVYNAAANASYCYDSDANKNISELTDSSGTVVAHYEYSPFGHHQPQEILLGQEL